MRIDPHNGGDEARGSMQLAAGRTGQEYNQRKDRKGAYWEDRYHATAVESGDHLARCMVYIDSNGEKARAEEWTDSIAVGGRHLVEGVKELLGFRAKGRKVIEAGEPR